MKLTSVVRKDPSIAKPPVYYSTDCANNSRGPGHPQESVPDISLPSDSLTSQQQTTCSCGAEANMAPSQQLTNSSKPVCSACKHDLPLSEQRSSSPSFLLGDSVLLNPSSLLDSAMTITHPTCNLIASADEAKSGQKSTDNAGGLGGSNVLTPTDSSESAISEHVEDDDIFPSGDLFEPNSLVSQDSNEGDRPNAETNNVAGSGDASASSTNTVSMDVTADDGNRGDCANNITGEKSGEETAVHIQLSHSNEFSAIEYDMVNCTRTIGKSCFYVNSGEEVDSVILPPAAIETGREDNRRNLGSAVSPLRLHGAVQLSDKPQLFESLNG